MIVIYCAGEQITSFLIPSIDEDAVAGAGAVVTEGVSHEETDVRVPANPIDDETDV